MFKRFLEYALMGAGTCVGYFAVKKGIETMSNPYKKAEVKKKIKSMFIIQKHKNYYFQQMQIK